MSHSYQPSIKEEMRQRGTCVVIPTYNNHQTVRSVVEDVKEYCDDVIVVNDGSTDGTGEILRDIAGITLVDYAKNRGKGYALKMGFRKALELGFSYAITLDADGQHYAKDIPSFIVASKQNPGALIVGKRYLEGVDRSAGSSFANKFSNFWFFVQTGCALEDTQTGYRLYPLKKLSLGLLTARYEAELMLMVFASWHGVKLVSTPIDVYYPPREERVSHFRPFKDFGRISVLNTVLCVLAVVYGLPLRICRKIMMLIRSLYAAFIFGVVDVVLIQLYAFIYLKVCKNEDKKHKMMRKLIYMQSCFFSYQHGVPGVKYSKEVAEGVTFDKPYVIISNHLSVFDTICENIFTPDVVYLTSEWVWHSPFLGLLARNAEYQRITNGIDDLLPKLRDLVSRGYSIAVYPEGTRSATNEIIRFHKGAFYIAQELGLDILPMVLYGSGHVLPKGKLLLSKGRFHVKVDKPILRAELDAMGDVRAQTSAVHQIYLKRYNELRNRMDQDA